MGENYITVVNPHFQDSTPIISDRPHRGWLKVGIDPPLNAVSAQGGSFFYGFRFSPSSG